jgi:putative hemolysin
VLADFAVVLVLVLLNGFLALSELAVVSSSRARLRAMADAGDDGARAALALAEQPGHFLSAVQVGITLVGLVAGVFSGTSIAEPFALWLEAAGLRNPFSDVAAFGLVISVVTYVSLIVGELVPKQVALQHPERMAARVAPAMRMLARVAWPVVWLLEGSSRLLLGLLGINARAPVKVTREEIKALIAEAERAGVMPPRARSMMMGAIRLGERGVRAIMTPRQDVDWIDLNADDATIRARLQASTHTRLPAGHGSVDRVVGVVRAKEVLDAYLAGRPADIRSFVREVPVVLDAATALEAMETLRASGAHIVLVVDEYGGFQGVVTTINVLEAIAGAFPAEAEAGAPRAHRRADGSWLLDGDLAADQMAEELGLVLPTQRDFHTVAGFVLSKTMHIPALGDSVGYRGWRFEVVDMDGPRIDKVLATRTGDRRARPG